jgi:hypothetical protein
LPESASVLPQIVINPLGRFLTRCGEPGVQVLLVLANAEVEKSMISANIAAMKIAMANSKKPAVPLL